MDTVLPFLSSAISFVFAAAVFAQYLARRKPYQLLWSLGLLFYGLSAGCEFLAGVSGWNVTVYRVWYVTGAFFVAAYLGMGTVYLLAPRRVAHLVMLILGLGSLMAIYLVFTASVNVALLPTSSKVSGVAMPNYVRLLTPIFNIFGTVALAGGALYSAWLFWRRQILPHRVVANILIAIGAFMPAIGGTLARFNIPEFFYLGELLGAVIIFIGFLKSLEPRTAGASAEARSGG
ncbi:MAG: hypothetical protein M1136_05900 [Chloroflexi bacterium]|nr:hypothetical protein [Chloroflexota bacterium]MCL5075171.1 hypothetical protein [Chloroflexota bacterium]